MASIQLSCWPKFPHVLSWKRTSIPPSSVIPKFLPLSQISLVLRHSSSYGHGYGGGIRGMAASSGAQMEESIKKKISENALVIYSKTSCPYCCEVKALFDRLGVKPSVVELDDLGPAQRQLQNALQRLTGQSTVPNIFIGHVREHYQWICLEGGLLVKRGILWTDTGSDFIPLDVWTLEMMGVTPT